MIYRVTATLKDKVAATFYQQLTDGTIQNRPPDGGEIVHAMQKAVIRDDGRVQWNMGCFCSTPLAHEREVVFDHFFDEIEIEPVGQRENYQGQSFIDYLASEVNK